MKLHFLAIFLIAIVSCSDTKYTTDDSGMSNSCEAGANGSCKDNIYRACVNGQWVEEDCGDKNCYAGYGCKSCPPDHDFCIGNDTYHCEVDGETSTQTGSCAEKQKCVAGECFSLCDDPDRQKSNVGCQFWAVDLPNTYTCASLDNGITCGVHYACAACQKAVLTVTNSSTYTAKVKVEINEAKPGETPQIQLLEEKEIAANSIGLFVLPMREVDCTEWTTDTTGKMRRTNDSQSCISSRAFRVTSDVPVVAYQFNPLINDSSNAASLLIPEFSLGKKYYNIGWGTTNPFAVEGLSPEGVPDYTYVTIVGVEDDTEVTVTPSHPIQASPDGKIPAANPGESFTVKINKYDVVNVNSRQVMPSHVTGDLTGTKVTADKNVVVFSGVQRASVPYNLDKYNPPPTWTTDEEDNCCTEHFEQQLFPISALGKSFAITRTPVRSTKGKEPDFYRILATENDTQVKTNLQNFPSFSIEEGKWVEFWSDTPFVVDSNRPIMIAQYASSQNYVGSDAIVGGDPEFIIFPPSEQYRDNYIFLVPPTYQKDYVVISSPQDNTITLDGRKIVEEFSAACESTTIGMINNEAYTQYICELSNEGGPHEITGAKPFGISVYGYYAVGSYGYPGGADVREINIVE